MEPQNTTSPDKPDGGELAPEAENSESLTHTAPVSSGLPEWPHGESGPTPSASMSSQPNETVNPSPMPVNQPVGAAVQPAAGTPAPQPAHTDSGNQNAGLIVLQWLTYAFWGWALLALSSLTASILANFITKAETGSFTPYAIAAVLVLLPAAFVCEMFYSKKEPVKKSGAALAVMVIHAVIFALFAVGALITSVFMLVSFFVSSGDTDSKLVVLLSALIIFMYYLLTFVRTLNVQKLAGFNKLFRYIMLVTVGVLIVLGIVGPVARERSLRDDRLLQDNLGDLSRSINNYTEDNGRLPNSLADLDIEGDTKQIVDRNLVEYNKVTDPPNTSQSSLNRRTGTDFYYELCATFKEESRYYDRYSNRSNEYDTYISAYYHPKGRHCYKAKTTVYADVNSSVLRLN